ncbi:hypothetical protein Efla_006222 [Eimeria flavescens]
MWDSTSRLFFPPAQLPPPPPPERAATPTLFSQVSVLPSRGPLILETRTVGYGSADGDPSLAYAQRKGSFESALSNEIEETARLRATLSGLRELHESLQIEQEKKKLARSVGELWTRLGDLEPLRRGGMGDRVKIHRLEQELNEAKRLINALTLERELREEPLLVVAALPAMTVR